MNTKKILFWALLLLCGTLILSCDSKKDPGTQSTKDAYADYILNYTKEEISPDDPIRIVFKKDIVKMDEINKGIGLQYLKTSPNLNGELIWESPSVLSFRAENMKFDQEYAFEMDLSKILEKAYDLVPSGSFNFSLKTIPLDFVTQYGPFLLQRASSGQSELSLRGNISFNHPLDSIDVKNMLSVSPSDAIKKIKWSHNGLIHQFELLGIERSDDIKALSLEWNAKEFNIKDSRKKRLIVPSESDFSVIEAKINPENPREIRMAFSDFLDKSQDFQGLVYCDDVNIQPEFQVEGNILSLIFRSNIEGEKTLHVNRKVKSESGEKLGKDFSKVLYFSSPKPGLKALNSGSITANIDQVILPFEAINLNAIDVEVSKVYQNNML